MNEDWHFRVAPPADTPDPRLGVRFDRTGCFLPEAGNTVVAQVIPGAPTETALIWLRKKLQALPCAGHFTFTDVSSYHMTVFEGVIESRRVAGHWPATLSLDADIDEATAAMTRLLTALPTFPSFAVRPVAVTPFGVTLDGDTEQDRRAVRIWRDNLSDALGYRSPRHDAHVLHPTLAYVHTWLPPSALPDYVADMERLYRAFATGLRRWTRRARPFASFGT